MLQVAQRMVWYRQAAVILFFSAVHDCTRFDDREVVGIIAVGRVCHRVSPTLGSFAPLQCMTNSESNGYAHGVLGLDQVDCLGA